MIEKTEKNLKLLEFAINEEHYFLQEHQARVKFYTGLISTLIAVTFAGLINSEETIHYYALMVGPILVFIISSFAIKGTFRLYQRFLEAVTVRAKLEQELRLTKRNENSNSDDYWKNEPIIASRHINSRLKHESSESFIKKASNKSNKGYHLWSTYLFIAFQVISIIMIIGLLIISIYQ